MKEAAAEEKPDQAQPAQPARPATQPVPNPSELTAQLKWYYAKLFPISHMSRWLRYGRDETLSRREISFTLPGDIYLRWRSFPNQNAFHSALNTSAPIKIDIGAVYNFNPADKHLITGPLRPDSKELVFDIDLTDYSSVLADMANPSDPMAETDACWPVIATAVKVLDAALREDFGFVHILWVYSGRRGVHCWVADQSARSLNNDQRSAIADYLYLRFEQPDQQTARRNYDLTFPLHPSLSRAKTLCDQAFRQFTLEQAGILNSHAEIFKTLSTIPGRLDARDIADKVARVQGPVARWQALERHVSKLAQKEWSLRGACDYLVLKHVYPRIDANVSRDTSHLLKAPFSVHPKTGRVCVPFLPAEVDSFRPDVDAPHISSLIKELDAKAPGPHQQKLESAVRILKQFVDVVEKEALASLKLQKLEQVDTEAVVELLAHA